MKETTRMKENRKFVFLLPSAPFTEENINVKLKMPKNK